MPTLQHVLSSLVTIPSRTSALAVVNPVLDAAFLAVAVVYLRGLFAVQMEEIAMPVRSVGPAVANAAIQATLYVVMDACRLDQYAAQMMRIFVIPVKSA